MTAPETDVAAMAARLPAAHRRLVARLSNRWIRGTGIVHRSVGDDLVKLGIAEQRFRNWKRGIRAMPLALKIAAHLQSERSSDAG